MKRYFESEEIIRDQLLIKNDDPELWLLLSEIQKNSQNILGYHQSRAEYLLLLGRDEQALNQLEFALKMTANNFQASERIMTKIVEIKAWENQNTEVKMFESTRKGLTIINLLAWVKSFQKASKSFSSKNWKL